jgi:protein-S-isoprenylcysteine O-methyltransferase Ste14
MPREALAFYAIYLVAAFGVRTAVHYRRTGSTGFRGLSGRPGSAEWWGGLLFALALLVGVAAPILQLLDVVEPIEPLDTEFLQAAGAGLFLGGLLNTVVAQFAMGDSWRIGVDESERTQLVTSGPFSVVRNPIFAAMIPASLGLALLAPNPLAIVGFVALLVALEIQVRLVEEPYLLSTHGRAYSAYAARVGRFFPWVGRLRPDRA